MKRLNRIAPLAAAFAIFFSGCGSDRLPTETAAAGIRDVVQTDVGRAAITTVRIPYSADDNLNPYRCVSLQNSYVAGLLYDALVALSPSYVVENRIAQEITMTGNACLIKLRNDALFSDGTPVLAGDVLQSLAAARQSTRFAAALSHIADAAAPDDSTVVITLSEPDRYFPAALTFPILKAGTEQQDLPTGCGRYLLSGTGHLTSNARYYTPIKKVRTVELVDAPTVPRQTELLLENRIDLFYSESRTKLDLSEIASTRQVATNNLIFLGVNSQRNGFSPELRVVFSQLIDRAQLVRKALLGYASVASSPLNTALSNPSAGGSANQELSLEALQAQLNALGYGQRTENGVRTNGQRELSYTLMVNEENFERTNAADFIAECFARADIALTVEKVPFETYTARIASGDYDFYLGEVKLTDNLDLTSLVVPGTLGAGLAYDAELQADYRAFQAGELELTAFEQHFRSVMPVVPIAFRRGIVCFSEEFSANMVATEQDIFYNIDEW